jgi:hypothetical protein
MPKVTDPVMKGILERIRDGGQHEICEETASSVVLLFPELSVVYNLNDQKDRDKFGKFWHNTMKREATKLTNKRLAGYFNDAVVVDEMTRTCEVIRRKLWLMRRLNSLTTKDTKVVGDLIALSNDKRDEAFKIFDKISCCLAERVTPGMFAKEGTSLASA